jgi:hypothetical protein
MNLKNMKFEIKDENNKWTIWEDPTKENKGE